MSIRPLCSIVMVITMMLKRHCMLLCGACYYNAKHATSCHMSSVNDKFISVDLVSFWMTLKNFYLFFFTHPCHVISVCFMSMATCMFTCSVTEGQLDRHREVHALLNVRSLCAAVVCHGLFYSSVVLQKYERIHAGFLSFCQSYLCHIAWLLTVAFPLSSGWATESPPPSPPPHFTPVLHPAATGLLGAGSARRLCGALTASLSPLPPSAATLPPPPPHWTRTPLSARVESVTQTWPSRLSM